MGKRGRPRLTEEEKIEKQITKLVQKLDTGQLKERAEILSMIFRAFEGQPIEPKDAITRLTNVNELVERSRFPTYPLLGKNVYLRLMHDIFGEDALICKIWADWEAKALIEYKGEGRKEYTEGLKHASSPEQMFYLGLPREPQPTRQTRFSRFRKPKEETGEFVNQ